MNADDRSGARTRKEVQLNNYRREEQLALKNRALSASAEGITISDARLPDNPLIYANSGFERLTGYAVKHILGKNCRFLQGPGTDPATLEKIRDALREERECVVEILNYRKDGSPFWNRLSITPVKDAQRKVTHYLGVQSDITARKRAEDALRRANEKLEVANRRMKSELDMAAAIQRTLLPSADLSLKGAEISWIFQPCDELAGDTLNFISLDEDLLGLYIIDVSGHGVGAALMSVTLHHLLSHLPDQLASSRQDENASQRSAIFSPSAVAKRLNRRFPMDANTAQYFSMIYGVLNLRSGQFRYVSAGHPSPIVLPPESQPFHLPARGFPIGMFPNAEYTEGRIVLSPGDRLFLYTDGLTEATNEEEQEFGSERLMKAIGDSRSLSLQRSLNQLLETLRIWQHKSRFMDDVSALAVQYTGVKFSKPSSW